jgi:hypothetical protein
VGIDLHDVEIRRDRGRARAVRSVGELSL